MSLSRLEVTQDREKLIHHLHEHLEALKLQRSRLVTSSQPVEQPVTDNDHQMSKYQLEKVISANRFKLVQLQKKYHMKKQLESLGVHPMTKNQLNLIRKSNGEVLYDTLEMGRRKIVVEELTQAKSRAQQQRKSRKEMAKQQKSLYQSIVLRQKGQGVSNKLARVLQKSKLSLIDQEFILVTVFDSLKDSKEVVNKQKLKDFMTFNSKVGEHFHIGKRELNGDLMVYSTKRQGELDYRQFFEFVKSIQITYRAMNPSKLIKPKVVLTVKNNSVEGMSTPKDKSIQIYERYLKQLFTELDKKMEGILGRQLLAKFVNSPPQTLTKPYKLLDRSLMREFEKRLKRFPLLQEEYYKELSLAYLSPNELVRQFQELFEMYSGSKKKEQPVTLISQSDSKSRQEVTQQQSQNHEQENADSYPQIVDSGSQQALPDNSLEMETIHLNNSVRISSSQIAEFDHYYKTVGRQYQGVISSEINHLETMSAEFKKLETYITHMDQKMNI